MKSKGAKFLFLPDAKVLLWLKICSLFNISCCKSRGVKSLIYSAELSASSRMKVLSWDIGAYASYLGIEQTILSCIVGFFAA